VRILSPFEKGGQGDFQIAAPFKGGLGEPTVKNLHIQIEKVAGNAKGFRTGILKGNPIWVSGIGEQRGGDHDNFFT
jgi:hypothetical protein